jgi:hypothetical protein
MRKLLLPVVLGLSLGLSLITGCSVAVTAKTQTRYTKDIAAQSTKADWNGTGTITIDDATLDVLVNGGVTVTGDPNATKVTVTGRAVAYADSTDEASADLTIADVLSTFVINEATDGSITVTCGHGSAHGSSSSNHSGCEALNITVPAGTEAKPLPLVVKVGSGDVSVTGTVGSLNINDNGSGDITASHTPTKGSTIQAVGSFDISLALPSTFAADSITLTADSATDIDTTAFPDVMSGKGRGTAGTGAASIALTTSGVGKLTLKSQ